MRGNSGFVYLSRGFRAWLLPSAFPRSSASMSLSLTDWGWDVKDRLGSVCRKVGSTLTEVLGPGVEDTVSFWKAISRSTWDWSMEWLGDGKGGKISSESSKKVGSRAESSVMVRSEAFGAGMFLVSVFWAMGVSVLFAVGSFWGVLVG